MTISTQAQAEARFVKEVMDPSPHDFVILSQMTQERDFGWVFFYTTRGYAETRNPKFMVPGVGPVVVTINGEVVPLSTSAPPAAAIAIFADTWAKAHP